MTSYVVVDHIPQDESEWETEFPTLAEARVQAEADWSRLTPAEQRAERRFSNCVLRRYIEVVERREDGDYSTGIVFGRASE